MARMTNEKWIIICIVAFMAIILFCMFWHDRPVVHYAKQLEVDQLVNTFDGRIGSNFRDEVFIIENPPTNHAKLMDIIIDNERYCPIDKKRIEARYDYFMRSYYKESRRTPVNFVQKNKDDDLGNESHRKDMICWIEMKRSYGKRRKAALIVADSLGVWPSQLPTSILDSIAHLPDSIQNGYSWKWECNCPELGY